MKREFSSPTPQPTHILQSHPHTHNEVYIHHHLSCGTLFRRICVRYNTFYDNPTTSMNIVACSNGDNGLVTKFPTFGDLPTFPSAGGVFAVSGWNSPECGSCWRLKYKGNSIYVTAIDTISDGFDISLTAMNLLTNNQAQALDSIDAHAEEVDRSFCGTA